VTQASDLFSQSASDLAVMIARGEVSSAAVVEAHIARIEATNPALNALVWSDFPRARADAKAADAAQTRGASLGPLHGVPITIKECIDVAGSPSTFGLTTRATTNADSDAAIVTALRAAGAIILGKTNVAQMLLYYESDNPVYGRTNNPWNPARTPGGSSGGEGAIIAAGGSPLGIGTDIGGSVRIPAAFCGIAALKPTTGRLNDPGRFSVPFGQRAVISQYGPLARHVGDLALAMDILNGVDGAPPRPLGDYRKVDLGGVRIGYYTNDGTLAPSPAIARAVEAAADALRQRGATLVEWTPPDIGQVFALYYGILSADGGAGNKRAFAGGKRDRRAAAITGLAGMNRSVRAMLAPLLRMIGQPGMAGMLGLFGARSTDQSWQLVERQLDYQARFADAMDAAQIDAILCPPCALPAFTHGASETLGNGGAYAILYNLLGFPAGVVPFTTIAAGETCDRVAARDSIAKAAWQVDQDSAGLPIGVQIAAKPWREDMVLAIMAELEKCARTRADYPVTPRFHPTL